MTANSAMFVCSKGHNSSEPDYCSECGAKIGGAPAAPAQGSSGLTSSPSPACPDCGTPREQTGIAFCEVCGYNFNTGAHGELNIMAASDPSPSVPPPAFEQVQSFAPEAALAVQPTRSWAVEVSIEPSLRTPESPEPPPDFAPFTVALDRAVSLIGRTNEARAIFPEIALPLDEAVSRRHALLQRDADTGELSLRDIGSANGTRLNGKAVEPMVDTPLTAGDQITLGHWTRLTLQAKT